MVKYICVTPVIVIGNRLNCAVRIGAPAQKLFVMKHKIFSYEKDASLKVADRMVCISEEEFDTAQEAHKRFTQGVTASLFPASPMRITWTGAKGEIVADYIVKKPL